MAPAYEDELATVYLGDCLEVLRALPDASVDAVVTDPPAGIEFMGKEWDTFKQKLGRLAKFDRPPGEPGERPTGATFTSRMGANPGFNQRAPKRCRKCGHQQWSGSPCQCPEPDWEIDLSARTAFIAFMTEVMAECLRVLKPGGHALVWAIPRTSHWTGTAIEDAGFEVRDFVCHHFGSGFPKSLDVSKAIDKAAGAEREVVEHKGAPVPATVDRTVLDYGGATGKAKNGLKDGYDTTAPATDAAKEWQGWGTALKPATEIWWEARKPLAEPNVASQVLVTGTGALNIDACRVGTEPAFVNRPGRKSKGGILNVTEEPRVGTGGPGRWPANLVLTHSPDCRQVGTRKVKGITGGTGNHEGGVYGARTNQGQAVKDYADPDGTETVEAWECAPGCPVPELDRQSGDRPGASSNGRPADSQGFTRGGSGTGLVAGYGDQGGASRFYPTFRYTAKASGAERNAGLFDSRKGRNLHPTVKPIELMRWLCRLITPPGGIVLDPFAGSGTTLLAAKLEGFRSIGIEKEPEHVEIIKRRLEWAKHQPALFTEAAG